MSTVATTPDEQLEPQPNRAAAAVQWVIDRPLIMLSVILVLLVIACEIVVAGIHLGPSASARSCSSRRRWRSWPRARRW